MDPIAIINEDEYNLPVKVPSRNVNAVPNPAFSPESDALPAAPETFGGFDDSAA